jgi:hypothetical protein
MYATYETARFLIWAQLILRKTRPKNRHLSHDDREVLQTELCEIPSSRHVQDEEER